MSFGTVSIQFNNYIIPTSVSPNNVCYLIFKFCIDILNMKCNNPQLQFGGKFIQFPSDNCLQQNLEILYIFLNKYLSNLVITNTANLIINSLPKITYLSQNTNILKFIGKSLDFYKFNELSEPVMQIAKNTQLSLCKDIAGISYEFSKLCEQLSLSIPTNKLLNVNMSQIYDQFCIITINLTNQINDSEYQSIINNLQYLEVSPIMY